jgi:hypothetical protein
MSRNQLRISAIAAAAGILACIAAFCTHAHAFFLGYLVVAVTISAIPAGALGVLLLSYLVRGPWTDGLHAPLVAAVLTTPVAGILFVPVLVGMPWIYPWAQHAASDLGSLKAIYLTPVFFVGRTLLYFALWTVIALWARRAWGDNVRMTFVASAGLILYALTASFAGIDWLESLTPEFHSSIYGLLILTFQVLAGYSFALVVGLWPRDAPPHRYGAILLSVLLLWAYNHAMQYIIIWSGNIPEEVIWYARRESGAWGFALWSLIILQFVLPFFVLLAEKARSGRRALLAMASATLLLRLLDAAVMSLPGTGTEAWPVSLAILGAALALASFWSRHAFRARHAAAGQRE